MQDVILWGLPHSAHLQQIDSFGKACCVLCAQ